MIRFYSIVESGKDGPFAEELNQCLNSLDQGAEPNFQLYRLVFFVHVDSSIEYVGYYRQVAESVQDRWGDSSPVFSVIAQSPLGGCKIRIEAAWINCVVTVNRLAINKKRVVELIFPDGVREVWAALSGDMEADYGVFDSANAAFENMIGILKSVGLTFNQVVRQWNYIPGILQYSHFQKQLSQNYQLFNEVRSYYYSIYRTKDGFPAATGIGTSFGPVCMEFCALSEDVDSYPVFNPAQVNPYQYGQIVLGAGPISGKDAKQPPQFERARLVFSENQALVYVSGTASIKGELTIGINDVVLQTRTTISLLEKLTNIDNLNQSVEGLMVTDAQWQFLRVYIKNVEDYSLIREMCLSHFDDQQVLSFVQADVCRDNLLLEIEGEMSVSCAKSLRG
jgi:enamine deaminase RidA (YjgF/YER057c/UK114 family)